MNDISLAAANASLVEADGIRVHCTQVGSGPALVWLHGAGPGATGMGNFHQNIVAFPDYRNLAFDFPRYGESDCPVIKGPMLTYLAKQISAALDRLGVRKATFVGNSLGGGTAMRIALMRPDLVDRLVLMAGAGTIPPGHPLTPTLQLMAVQLKTAPSRDKMEAMIRGLVFDPSSVTPEMVDARFASASDPRRVSTGAASDIEIDNLAPELSKITAKTLIIWGREDRVLPLEWGMTQINGLPNAEARIVPHCGHWVQYEHPEWFNRAVRDFLSN